MNFPFNPEGEVIPVEVALSGPAGTGSASFSLDTGATRSLVSRDIVVGLGYDLSKATNFSHFITGSGVETAPRINIDRIEALGQERRFFPIVCHTLPSGSPIDGLLGLDFFRGQKLTVDFRAGLVTLE